MSEKCEQCGTRLKSSWLDKTDGVLLCRDCLNGSTTCDDCGEVLPRKQTVTIKKRTMCRECMLKDELPIEVVLVQSNWAPWDEESIAVKGELLFTELAGKKERQVPQQYRGVFK